MHTPQGLYWELAPASAVYHIGRWVLYASTTWEDSRWQQEQIQEDSRFLIREGGWGF